MIVYLSKCPLFHSYWNFKFRDLLFRWAHGGMDVHSSSDFWYSLFGVLIFIALLSNFHCRDTRVQYILDALIWCHCSWTRVHQMVQNRIWMPRFFIWRGPIRCPNPTISNQRVRMLNMSHRYRLPKSITHLQSIGLDPVVTSACEQPNKYSYLLHCTDGYAAAFCFLSTLAWYKDIHDAILEFCNISPSVICKFRSITFILYNSI
jgi:hypothetical protein